MSRAKREYTVEDLERAGRIELPHFTKEDAFELGTIAAGVIREWGVNLAVDIVIGEDLVYRAKLGTTGKGNDEWLAGKAAVARHFGDSSLLVRLRQEQTGVPFTNLDLDHSSMKAHGGSIPLRVDGEIIGTITMSGEPDVVDHETVAEAVTRYLATI
ncbi:MAG TPA: heme-binding protein [Galbitalea sp.]